MDASKQDVKVCRGMGSTMKKLLSIILVLVTAFSYKLYASVVAPTGTGTGSFTMTWTEYPESCVYNTGPDYKLKEVKSGGSTTYPSMPSAPTRTKTISGLTNGSYTYTFSVRRCVSSMGRPMYTTYVDIDTFTVNVALAVTPGVPSSISAPALNDGTYSVSWGSSSGTVSRYELQRQLGSGSWSQLYSGSNRNYSISNLSNGSYTYRARACHTSYGTSKCSSWRTSNTAVTATPSSAPAITAPSTDGDGSFSISWGSISNTDYYILKQSVNSGSWTTLQSSSSRSRSFSGISDASYRFQVFACNGKGCSSGSSIKTTNVARQPGVPSSITVPSLHGTTSLPVNWAASSGSLTAYDLDYSRNGGSWTSLYDGTSRNINQTVSVASYQYRVRACKTVGSYSNCSGWRTSITATVAIPSSAPSITLASTDADGSYSVSWGSVSNSSKYTLQEQVNSGSWVTIQDTSARSRSISGKGNNSYSYRVRACNGLGCGTWSSSKKITVAITPPTPSTISVPSNLPTNSFTLSWSSVSGRVTSYKAYQSRNNGSWSSVYSGTATSVNVSNLTDGNYQYRVRVCNKVDSFETCSGYRTSSTMNVAIAPSQPSSVTTPGFVGGPFTASWAASSGTITSYNVELYNGSSWITSEVSNINLSARTATISPTRIGAHRLRVRACNGSNCSSWRESSNFNTGIPPYTPGLSMPSTSNTGSFNISWEVNTATRHTLQRSTNGTSWSNVATDIPVASFNQSISDGRYYYRGIACNGFGCTAPGGSKYIDVAKTPGTPGQFVIANNTGEKVGVIGEEIRFTWGVASGTVTQYELQSSDNNSNWANIYAGPRPQNTYFSTARYYRVRACNLVGSFNSCGAWRNSGEFSLYEKPEENENLNGGYYDISAPRYADYQGIEILWKPLPWDSNARYLVIETEFDKGSSVGRSTVLTDMATETRAYRPFPNIDKEYTYSVCAIDSQTGRCYTINGEQNYMESLGFRIEIIPSPDVVTTVTDAVGSTPYTTSVDRKGNSVVEIPIKVLPGNNQVQPAISFVYNSGAVNQENMRFKAASTLGRGWSLSGFSEIYRCKMKELDYRYSYIIYQDNYWQEVTPGAPALRGRPLVNFKRPDANYGEYFGAPETVDGLCLDDQPLVLVSGEHLKVGAVYRTYEESYKRIEIKSNDSDPETRYIWFEIKQPDGGISKYGSNPDSRYELDSDDDQYDEYFKWAIDTVTDTFGNYIHYNYTGENSAVVPGDLINSNSDYRRYDGDGYIGGHHKWVFADGLGYFGSKRPEYTFMPLGVHYTSGNAIVNVDFIWGGLLTISVGSGSEHRNYNFTFDHLQECSGQSCLPALEFDYHQYLVDRYNTPYLEKITDGIGATTTFEYSPELSARFVEQPYYPTDQFGPESAALPKYYDYFEFDSFINSYSENLVTHWSKQNGEGGLSQNWSYAYSGYALASGEGRGYLGRSMRRITDEQTGITTYTAYRLVEHLVGRKEYEVQYPTIYTPGLAPIYEEHHEYEIKSIQHSNGAYTYVPVHTQERTRSFEEGVFVGGGITTNKLVIDGGFPSEHIRTSYGIRGSNAYPDLASFNLDDISESDILSTAINVSAYTNYCDACDAGQAGDWRIQFESEKTSNIYSGAIGGNNVDVKTSKTTKTPWENTFKVGERTTFKDDPTNELITTYTYDSKGNVTSTSVSGYKVEPRTSHFNGYIYGPTPSYIYNALGHSASNVAYDYRFGKPTLNIDPNGVKTQIKFDAFERVIETIDANGNITTVEYVLCDDLRVTCDASSEPVAYVKITTPQVEIAPAVQEYFDYFDRPVLARTESFEDNQYIHIETIYDAAGRIKSSSTPYITVSERFYIHNHYDSYGRQIKQTRPDGGVTEIVYDTVTIDDITYTRTITMDKVFDSGGGFKKTRVKVAVSDAMGRLVESTDGLASEQNISRNTSIDSLDWSQAVTTRYFYDAFGNVNRTEVDSDDGTTVSEMEFDNAGNRILLTGPNIGTITTTHTALGQIDTSTDAENRVTSFSYDLLGRVLTKTQGSLIDTFTYDENNILGMPSSVSNNEGYFLSYQYDDAVIPSRMTGTNENIQVNGVSQSAATAIDYDVFGRVDTQTFASGITIKNHFKERGFITHISNFENGDVLQEIETVGVHGVEISSLGNGTYTESKYRPENGLLNELTHFKENGNVFYGQKYSWSTSGNLETRGYSKTGSSGSYTTELFEYDNQDRLVLADIRQNNISERAQSYTYFDNGNIASKISDNVMDTQVTNYVYGEMRCGVTAGPHAVTSALVNGNGIAICYDKNGYITQYSRNNANNKYIEYNYNGQPLNITVGDSANDSTPEAQDEFKYNPNGGRYFKRSSWMSGSELLSEETYYFNDGTELTLPSPETGNSYKEITKTVISGNIYYISRTDFLNSVSTEIEYIHRDHLGSVIAVSNDAIGSSSPVQENAFDPFGERRSSDWFSQISQSDLSFILGTPEKTTNRGFTGHEHLDRTGFIHMNGRVYDPELGRFLTPDPLVQAPTFSQSWNRYSYVWNNPLRFTDPSGYSARGGLGSFAENVQRGFAMDGEVRRRKIDQQKAIEDTDGAAETKTHVVYGAESQGTRDQSSGDGKESQGTGNQSSGQSSIAENEEVVYVTGSRKEKVSSRERIQDLFAGDKFLRNLEKRRANYRAYAQKGRGCSGQMCRPKPTEPREMVSSLSAGVGVPLPVPIDGKLYSFQISLTVGMEEVAFGGRPIFDLDLEATTEVGLLFATAEWHEFMGTYDQYDSAINISGYWGLGGGALIGPDGTGGVSMGVGFGGKWMNKIPYAGKYLDLIRNKGGSVSVDTGL